jgi:hypothetical protein
LPLILRRCHLLASSSVLLSDSLTASFMQAQEVRSCLQNVLWAERGKFNPIVKQSEAQRHPKFVKRTASQLSVGQAENISRAGSTGSTG